MPTVIPSNSVGLVTPQSLHFSEPIQLECQRTLASFDIVYETYGTLNNQADNAVLICHALSGNHHAAGYHSMDDKKPGWWDSCIGPGKVIDTNKFFVVALNNLGGCAGSTGPASLNPETGKPWGADFPMVTVKDWVQVQAHLSDCLGIRQWAAIVGGSLGGMQVMQWAIDYPERIRHAVVIASAPKLSAQNIAFNEVARQAILTDPEFFGGHFYENNVVPRQGLMLARMVGHITYLSEEAMKLKFGRELNAHEGSEETEFSVQSYLRHQGQKFARTFDANTYLRMVSALDNFDLSASFGGDLAKALSHSRCHFLVVSFSTDWRFAPERSKEIVDALIQAGKPVSYADIDAPQGHDSFLLDHPRYLDVFGAYMSSIVVGGTHAS